MIKITSYNCNSIRNNCEIVKSLLRDTDILLLQEIMLEKSDLDILNNFNGDFRHISYVKDRESDGFCEGRPSGGVAIFWRTHLTKFVSSVFVDHCLIGVVLKTSLSKILLLNMYLPCDMQTSDALHRYRQSLGVLNSVINEQNVNKILLVGDANADPSKGRFWKLFNEFTHSLSLQTVGEKFPHSAFTYLCPSRDTTSWLDHVVCTPNISDKISKICVEYDNEVYDHFPLSFYLNISFDTIPVIDKDNVVREFVNWNRMSVEDRCVIAGYID